MSTRDPDLSSTAAYHVQQCVEKIAKAVFIARGITITKEHRLSQNVDSLIAHDANEPWVAKLRPFEVYDRFATAARYPSTTGKLAMGPDVDKLDADLKRARRLLEDARKELRVSGGT